MHLVPLAVIIHTDGMMGTRCARQEAFTLHFTPVVVLPPFSFALGDLPAKANMAESLSNDGMAIKIMMSKMRQLINQMIDRKLISSCYYVWIIIFWAKMLICCFQFLKYEDFIDIFRNTVRPNNIWRNDLGLYEIQTAFFTIFWHCVDKTIKKWLCTDQAIIKINAALSYCIFESSQDPTRAKFEVKAELMCFFK